MEPTTAELIGWLVLLVGMVLFIAGGLWRYNRNCSEVSDEWTSRHIDDRGNYRA